MAVLKGILAGVLRGLRAIHALLGHLLATLFGSVDWYAPDWLRFLGRRIREGGTRVREQMRAHPRRSAGIGALVLLLIALVAAGWHWYQHLPKPRMATITLTAPERTCYECDPPGRPNPLRLEFSESAAPLDAAGKPLDAARKLAVLSPAQAGQWRWEDDLHLVFEPSEDWPVGQEFSLKLARRGLIAEQLRLEDYALDFTAPAFVAQVRSAEFHQDPRVASDKRAVLTLAFSHPADAADFEKRIALRLHERISEELEEDRGAVAYTVRYDRLRLEAYVTTEPLKMPAKQGRLAFTVDAGLRAARGGNTTADALKADVAVPGRDSLAAETFKLDIARDENQEPRQVALLEFNFPVAEAGMPPKLKAWLLPLTHPDAETQARYAEEHPGEPFDWSGGVDNRIVERAQPLALTAIPGEQDTGTLHSFSHSADPGRWVYARLEAGIEAFGGYRLAQTQERVLRVPDYPRELRVVAPGSLLALSGPRLLNVMARDVPAMKVEVARVLPRQLQHLVSQTRGDFSTPEFVTWSLNEDNLTERFTRTERLPRVQPGAPAYTALDLSPYLKDEAEDRRGIFLLRLNAWDVANDRALMASQTDAWGNSFEAPVMHSRLIVVTDLGLVSKRNQDGSSDVFVQSIHSGAPVAGVRVEVIGRNGLAVLERTTDAEGHALLPTLKDFERERAPVMLVARKEGDTSFLPLDYRVRELDLSRYEVGGVANAAQAGALSAYLFSDRGVYRPGEEIRLGAIVRTQDWRALPQGLPLLLEVSDPRGQIVRSEKLPLSTAGFEDIRQATKPASPTGAWTFNLWLMKGLVGSEREREALGSVSVLVREFEPDRLKMSAQLSTQRAQGWVAPEKLSARVQLQNLFGAPAQKRRVTASLRLSPSLPEFTRYRDYRFSDPQLAREGFTEELSDATTNDEGEASFDLRLERFAKATYRVQLLAQGFEADGGRGVATQLTQLVSSLPYLVGVKTDGDLGYVSRNAERAVKLLAIDPALDPLAVQDLKVQRLELKYVSSLVKQNSGVYQYESRRRETMLDESPLTITRGGQALKLDTREPGTFAYRVLDVEGQLLARVDYSVAGAANLSARLEKNAELALKLSKNDYAPGEEIEMQITAPYVGSGLITIERDKVYAWQWFTSSTTASTQRIRLPAGLEGNAYVSVSFARDPGSPEIYTSPLAYAVAPFSINVDARRETVQVSAPERVRPGETLEFRYRSAQPARLLLFAVDEGILQVARYTTPDPLGFFFQKKSLDVGTMQILDLILPEFRAALAAAAPGGDADGLLARHLNPFRRRGDAPVAYWSGLVEADASERVLRYTVPDHFNGRLRVMAVAVSDQAIGVYEGATTVRGDFVLSPNLPTFVAPGDEFDLSLGVSNQAEGSGKDARIALKLVAGKGLEVMGAAEQALAVAEGSESSARFRLRATTDLGDASVNFAASLSARSAKRAVSVSVRPATVYRSTLAAGVIKPGGTLDLPVERRLHPQFREQEASISALPLGLAGGFVAYLDHYAHACTEQLLSQAVPALILARRPEFGRVQETGKQDFATLIDELRARQNPDGAYRYWPGGFDTQEFVSVYAQHLLVEAGERGQALPRDLLARGNDYLRTLAARDGDTLEQERASAYALYVLVRQGQTLGADASRLRERLETRYKDQWRSDIAAAWLAAALKLMKQDAQADALFARLPLSGKRAPDRWSDAMTSGAQLLYLAARHFPERLSQVPMDYFEQLADHVRAQRHHSLSAATTLLALDAYATLAAPAASGKLEIAERLADKSLRTLALTTGLFPRADFSADAGSLRFTNGAQLPAFASLAQSGFDTTLPQTPLREGFEILREYLDAQGKPVTSVKRGQELLVRLRYRSLTQASSWNVALVDLLPGGFEPIVPPAAADGAEAPGGNCAVCQPGTRADVAYADFREDRNVFYVSVTPELSEILYRVKATNTGTYVLPPAFGEGLYDRDFNARSVAGKMTVEAP